MVSAGAQLDQSSGMARESFPTAFCRSFVTAWLNQMCLLPYFCITNLDLPFSNQVSSAFHTCEPIKKLFHVQKVSLYSAIIMHFSASFLSFFSRYIFRNKKDKQQQQQK